MTDYLVDNSVWALASRKNELAIARLRRIESSPADVIVTCPPQVLKFCHSARSPAEYELLRQRISLGFPVERAPSESFTLNIQQALWESGRIRAAGAIDILIAGYALLNNVTILTADRDFLHIAAVTELECEFLAP